MDEILKSEGVALRKMNGSVKGLFKTMVEVGDRVKWSETEEHKSGHGSELLAVKRDRDNFTVNKIEDDKRKRVVFMNKVKNGRWGR